MKKKDKELLEAFIKFREEIEETKYIVIDKKYIQQISCVEDKNNPACEICLVAPRGVDCIYEFTEESAIAKVMKLYKRNNEGSTE